MSAAKPAVTETVTQRFFIQMVRPDLLNEIYFDKDGAVLTYAGQEPVLLFNVPFQDLKDRPGLENFVSVKKYGHKEGNYLVNPARISCVNNTNKVGDGSGYITFSDGSQFRTDHSFYEMAEMFRSKWGPLHLIEGETSQHKSALINGRTIFSIGRCDAGSAIRVRGFKIGEAASADKDFLVVPGSPEELAASLVQLPGQRFALEVS